MKTMACFFVIMLPLQLFAIGDFKDNFHYDNLHEHLFLVPDIEAIHDYGKIRIEFTGLEHCKKGEFASISDIVLVGFIGKKYWYEF